MTNPVGSATNAAHFDPNQVPSLMGVIGTLGTADQQGTALTLPVGVNPTTGAMFVQDLSGASGTTNVSIVGGTASTLTAVKTAIGTMTIALTDFSINCVGYDYVSFGATDAGIDVNDHFSINGIDPSGETINLPYVDMTGKSYTGIGSDAITEFTFASSNNAIVAYCGGMQSVSLIDNDFTSSGSVYASAQLSNGGIPFYQPVTPVSNLGSIVGSLINVSDTVQLPVANVPFVTVQLSGAAVLGSVQFEASVDNASNWGTIGVVDVKDLTLITAGTQFTTGGKHLYMAPAGGYTHIRTRLTAKTSGTVVTTIMAGAIGQSAPMTAAMVNDGTLSQVTTVANMTNGSVTMKAGTITTGTLQNLVTGTLNALAAGTITGGTLQNLNAGTITSVAEVVKGTTTLVSTVTTVSNLTNGSVNLLTGTVTRVSNLGTLESGTVKIDPTPIPTTLQFGTLGTAGGSFFGTLSAASGAGTKHYISGVDVVMQSGTADVRILAGTSIQGTGVLAAGQFTPGGGISKRINPVFTTGTNSELTYHFVGAGTAFITISYWKGV